MPLPPYDLIEAAWTKALDTGLPARTQTFLAHHSLFPTEQAEALDLRVGVAYAVTVNMLDKHVDRLAAALTEELGIPSRIHFEVDRAVTARVVEGIDLAQAEDVQRMVREVQESEIEAATASGTIGYYARLLAQVSLPYLPVNDLEWVRRNGRYSIRILAGSNTGLPFGSTPRILLCHLSTQAVLTGSPEVEVGSSRTDFLRLLGLPTTGGPRGTFQRVNRTLLSLANSAIRYQIDEVDAKGRPVAGGIHRFDPLAGYDFWFNWRSDGHQTTLWNSTVRLTDEFFEDLVQHAFPISMDALRQLQGSPLAIDIYAWLAYRMYSLRRPLTLPWKVLEAQFGGRYAETRFFRRNFIRRLGQVKSVYPELRVDPRPGGLHLLPSPTPVPQLAKRAHRRLSASS